MKTTLMGTQFTGSVESTVRDFCVATNSSLAPTPRPSNREWLPVPNIVCKRSEMAERTLRNAAWSSGSGEIENKLMGLIMLLGAASVAYGCWMLLQLAENWAGFQAGIGRLIE